MIEDGYRIAAQAPVSAAPADVLRLLAEPELLRQWMPGVVRLTSVAGVPGAQGNLTELTLAMPARFGEWTLIGRIDEVTSAHLRRTYELRSGDPYTRTVDYGLTSTGDGTLLQCEVRTVIPGFPQAAVAPARRVDHKSLVGSLEVLAQLCEGRRRPMLRRMFRAPTAQAL